MIRQLLLSVVLPALIAGAALLAAWRPWRRKTSVMTGGWAGGPALGLAFGAAFVSEAGWPAWPPRERWQWILPLAAAALVIGLVVSLLPRRPNIARVVGAALAAAAAGLMIRLPAMDGVAWRAGLAGAVFASILLVDPLAGRRPGVSLPAAYAFIFATAGGVLMLASFAKLALVAGALGVSCGAMAVVALLNPRFTLAGGGVIACGTLLPALLMTGRAYDYNELPWVVFGLPVVAPLVLWIGETGTFARRAAWVGVLLRIVLVLVPCALAVGLALSADADDDMQDDAGYGAYEAYP